MLAIRMIENKMIQFRLRNCSSLIGWFYPRFIFLQQVDQFIDGNITVHVSLHDLLSFIQRDLPRTTAHITKIRVRHLARAIYDASHDSDLHTLEMVCYRADAGRG